jgi:uncharacterized protein YcgI (DUF1989 family)
VVRLFNDLANPGPLEVDRKFYSRLAKSKRTPVDSLTVPIRSGWAWPVLKGQICRIITVEGPQVVDFNAWNLHDPRERFWAARTRQIEGSHVTTYSRLWSCRPYHRPMLTIIKDTLPTQRTANGGRCHDLLGTGCDPFIMKLMNNGNYDRTCYNNLARAIAPYHLTEFDVHDVLNLFQVTGLDAANGIYFTEPSSAKKGDFIEFFAEIDLLCAISNCHGGDLSVPVLGPDHGDTLPTCRPVGIEIDEVDLSVLAGWNSPEPVDILPVYGAMSPQA